MFLLGLNLSDFPLFFKKKNVHFTSLHMKAFFCNQFRSCQHVDKHKSEDLKEAKVELKNIQGEEVEGWGEVTKPRTLILQIKFRTENILI